MEDGAVGRGQEGAQSRVEDGGDGLMWPHWTLRDCWVVF